MLKALDEIKDIKEKLITQDKEMVQMKAEQLKVLNDLSAVEEQRLKLHKVIEDRQKKVTNSLISKEPALEPGVVEKVNEAAEQLDPSGSKGEAKVGKVPEQLVHSEEKGLKQNINSGTYFSAMQVNPLVGVPMYQHSTQGYGYQPALHSSPYFCKCLCVCNYHLCSEMHNVNVMCFDRVNFFGYAIYISQYSDWLRAGRPVGAGVRVLVG
jgi:hypothetical protein